MPRRGDGRYLEQGKGLYAWTKEHLLDTGDGLYFDNVSLDGNIGRAKFAYNSGQMVQAGALLYKATGDESYLKDAQRTARPHATTISSRNSRPRTVRHSASSARETCGSRP